MKYKFGDKISYKIAVNPIRQGIVIGTADGGYRVAKETGAIVIVLPGEVKGLVSDLLPEPPPPPRYRRGDRVSFKVRNYLHKDQWSQRNGTVYNCGTTHAVVMVKAYYFYLPLTELTTITGHLKPGHCPPSRW